MRKMASTFSFPVLPRKDIVAILFESQIANIKEEHLVNPTSDVVVSIYTNLLIYLDPLQDDHRQADFNALGQLENPDLHADSVRLVNLCRKINEVMASVSCPTDFLLRDLAKPDTHRNGLFLSAILNFCLHRETKLVLLQPFVDQVNIHEEQRNELESRISELHMEMSNLNEANEREQPFIAEVDGKVKELRQTIQELNNHQMLVKTSLLAVKGRATEIDEKISSAEFTLIQSAQENAKLLSRIVQSPDKLQGTLEEKKAIRDDVKNSERSAMQSFQEKSCTLDVYSKALKKMSKQLAQMHGTKEQADAAKTVEKDVKVLKAKQNDEGLLGMSLEAKSVERQGKVEQLEELKKAYEKEKNMKHEEVTKNLDSLKLELESKTHDFAARKAKVEALVVEGDGINKRKNLEIESGAATKHQLYKKCEEIVNEFHSYSQSIGSYLDGVQC
ncbi:kinetochore protein NUF2 homolog [Papaver somniferum]|uniref:kinetochore protein NUF2 homolog n=1 Tax=Papaver somniferum TaxID=3469 RepID=UPI000E7050E2|nr:kinetochore protein NUF2 homolog [Papaver somniferum]